MTKGIFRRAGLASAVTALGTILLPALGWAQAQGDYVRGSHPWGEGWHGGGMMMGMGFLMMILFFAVIVVIIVLVVRWIGGAGHANRHGGEAREILRARFARGEIDAAEFEERNRLLSG